MDLMMCLDSIWLMRLKVMLCLCKWTEINQLFGGCTGHQGIQGYQGSRPKRYFKQGLCLPSAITFLTKVFNAILCRQSPVWPWKGTWWPQIP
jgi:hypothetical protein